MAKIALLIGISDYGGALTSLPGTQADLKAMQRALSNPDVGAFDQVEVLPNPNRTEMEVAIESLFSDNRNREDLILLYFSGHGVRDDSGDLYFAVSNTQKTEQGRIRTSTAVRASEVQRYMSKGRSKRQVVILDCCFSGAFARDMTVRDAEQTVDVKAQLGGEGRAILTSSTATQVSYEKEEAGLYTRYLVQGLETGAADKDGNGDITADELHEYTREKVQEAAPSMQPEIYAAREGFKIILARAPQDDPKLVFRKEVNERAKQKRGKLSPIDQRAFKFRGKELGLSAPEIQPIIDEILQPYQAFWAKLKEFESAIQDMLEFDPHMGTNSINDLRYFQRVLKLRDEDIAELLTQYQIELAASMNNSPPVESTPASSKARELPRQQPEILEREEHLLPVSDTEHQKKEFSAEEPALETERGVDYTRLRDLLREGKWKEADQETANVMLKAAGKNAEKRGYLNLDEIRNFPCKDLLTIDRLWVHFSGGKLGFSVQKQIWLEVGGKLDFGKDEKAARSAFQKMCDRNGWRVEGSYISSNQVIFDTSAPEGHLPSHLPDFDMRFDTSALDIPSHLPRVNAIVWCVRWWSVLLSHPDL
jgi:hypothetical protein